jgi:hypothetical protein
MTSSEYHPPSPVRIFVILCLFLFNTAYLPAQLSGTRTIDLSGGGDYLSFTEAVNDLNTMGVSGPLTFNVKPGTYEEQFVIGNYPGQSESNRVTFQALPEDSAKVLLAFTYASGLGNYIIQLDNASHLTFKRLFWNAGLGINYRGRIFHLTGTSSDIRIQNNYFYGKNTSVYEDGAIIFSKDSPNNDLLIENNYFQGGNHSVSLVGQYSNITHGIIFRNNVCDNQTKYSIYISNTDVPIIENNIVTSSTAIAGIKIGSIYNEFRILGNKIRIAGSSGIDASSLFGKMGDPGIIANNFISIDPSHSGSGLSLSYIERTRIYHNSVLIPGGQTFIASSCLKLNTSGSEVDIQNNIFANLASGYAYYINIPSALSVSDYNDYYTTGYYVAYWDEGDLANLQTLASVSPGDDHSISVHPAFQSENDLHTTSFLLDNKGNDLTSLINTDIDGDVRSSTPDIGADEFTGSGASLAGNYTIGGSSPDYAGISAAVNDLNRFGISGAVTFLLRDDNSPYNEQLSVLPVMGADADNRVTFKPDPANDEPVELTCSFTSSDKNYIMETRGARYITLKDLVFSQSNSSYPRLILMTSDCSNDSIVNCIFNGYGSDAGDECIYISSATISKLVLKSNHFNGGRAGILIEASGALYPSDFIIDSNYFNNMNNSGIQLYGCKNYVISANEFKNNNSYNFPPHIALSSCTDGFRITRNRFFGNGSGMIRVTSYSGTSSLKGIIDNNFLYFSEVIYAGTGITCSNSNYIGIYHNTITSDRNKPSLSFAGLVITGGNNIEIKNNIICNQGIGYVVSATKDLLANFKYNALFSGGNSLIDYDGSGYAYPDLLEAELGYSLNSIVLNPVFTDEMDFHTDCYFLDAAGISIPGITTDLEGDLRGSPPDIGADEFDTDIEPINGGSYTIGGISPDYISVSEAFSDLQSRGISGPVTFKIRKDVYPEIPGTIFSIPGSSPANTVVFESETGNPEDVVIYGSTSTAKPDIFDFTAIENLTLKGLTISATGVSDGRAVKFTGTSRHIRLIDNILSSDNTNDPVFYLTGYSDDLLVRDNEFIGGRYGISIEGGSPYSKGLNIISNRVHGGSTYGMSIKYQDSPRIIANEIINTDYNWNSAIQLVSCSGSILINGNRIDSKNYGNGINLDGCQVSVPFRALVCNNQIHIGGAWQYASRGIDVINSERTNLYHNSIHISSLDTTTSAGIRIRTGNTGVNAVNNILCNSGGGYALLVEQASGLFTSDYNDFFTTGKYLARWESADVSNLAALKSASGKETNSLSLDPLFTSDSDLHSAELALNEKGTPLPEVAFDFDSLPRDPLKPDIGAFENTCKTPDFHITVIPGCLGDTTIIMDNSTGILAGSSIAWDFDGDYVPELYSDGLNDTIRYFFGTPGIHQCNCIVTQMDDECLDSKEFEVEVFEPPELSVTTEGAYCDTADGRASVSVLNGDGPYEYYWSTGSRNAGIMGLDIGFYTIAVTDSNQCISTQEVFVGEAIEVTVTQIREATCSKEDGIAMVSASGGFPPYTYVWSDGDTTEVDSSLAAGQHFVNVIDSRQCYARESVIIDNDGSGPQIALKKITHAKCYGDKSGAIDINVSGGASPYLIKWSNGRNTEDLEGLAAGIYNVTIKDNNNCIGAGSFEIRQPLKLSVTPLVEDATCGGYDGIATAIISGGTKPYSYFWSNGSNAPVAQGLAAGIYALRISDVNGCETTEAVIINNAGGPAVSFEDIKGVGCMTTNIGEIHIAVSGSGPYTYEWSPNGEVTPDIIGLSPGTYEIKVTDKNGCMGFNKAEIVQEPPPVNPICLVTVDSVTQMNMIAWEKLDKTDVAYYNIYRESDIKGDYQLIGSRHVDSLSWFTDSIADPTIHSWRYKLSVVDVCGNESELSEQHKTIHLTMNLGLDNSVNLIWDKYEGFKANTYKVYRYSSTLDWQNIASLASNLSSYTDKNPPVADLFYYIEVPHPAGCTVTDYKAATLNTARSNRKSRKKSSPDYTLPFWDGSMEYLRIYPNPGSGIYSLSFNQALPGIARINILDISGRVIAISEIRNPMKDVEYSLDLSTREDGIYQVVINYGSMIYHRILIKE